eukprot:1157622-Pelagomonas_calceolata.AAC.2
MLRWQGVPDGSTVGLCLCPALKSNRAPGFMPCSCSRKHAALAGHVTLACNRKNYLFPVAPQNA